MKISQRLQQINQMIVNDYQHIWDCCCDHGLLGAALLERKAAQQIHFVDVVPNLMQQLEHKLQRFYPQTAKLHNQHGWQVHSTDVGQLDLADKHTRQLVIIAGVGGDLTIALIIEFPSVITLNVVVVGDLADPLLTCGKNHIANF